MPDLKNKFIDAEEIMEALEILSNKKLMAEIKKAERDIKAGRFKEIQNAKELKS